jgi:hypothetical protein
MDKQERKLKGKYKFIKRLKKYGYKAADAFKENYNLWVFKTTGSPCSCWMCRGDKFNRKIKHKNKIDE